MLPYPVAELSIDFLYYGNIFDSIFQLVPQIPTEIVEVGNDLG
jgi:hypothetical protein